MPQINTNTGEKKGLEVFHKYRIIFLLVVMCLINVEVFANTSEKLPDSLIFLPENTNAILVEKSSQQVFLYSNAGTQISRNLQFLCSTGEAYGDKEKSGDKKTPEGVYFIKDRYEDKDLSAIYGKKAFPIDYPNFLDKAAGKSGNNIWLHGTNKVLKAMDSNGCVAMEDDNILSLSDYIAINKTPVIIVDKLSMVDNDELSFKRSMIMEWFDGWENAVNSDSYHDYLSFYDRAYLPEIMWWKNWYAIKNKTEGKIGNIIVTTSNRGIYHHDNTYVIIFNIGLKLLKQNVDLGIRKFFVTEKDNTYKIIGDVYQSLNIKASKQTSPLVYAASNLVRQVEQGPDIREVVENWVKAWTNKDMEVYASYYSKDFHSDGLNKREWVQRKTNLAERYDYIKVMASNLQVNKGKKNIVVKFLQDYQSSGFSATGIKTLIFINEDKGWKIYHESWKKK